MKLEEHERSLYCEVKTTYEGEGVFGSVFIPRVFIYLIYPCTVFYVVHNKS